MTVCSVWFLSILVVPGISRELGDIIIKNCRMVNIEYALCNWKYTLH